MSVHIFSSLSNSLFLSILHIFLAYIFFFRHGLHFIPIPFPLLPTPCCQLRADSLWTRTRYGQADGVMWIRSSFCSETGQHMGLAWIRFSLVRGFRGSLKFEANSHFFIILLTFILLLLSIGILRIRTNFYKRYDKKDKRKNLVMCTMNVRNFGHVS